MPPPAARALAAVCGERPEVHSKGTGSVWWAVRARNPAAAALRSAAAGDTPKTQISAALDPACPIAVLTALTAHTERSDMRVALTERHGCPMAALAALTADPDAHVRFCLAEASPLSARLMERLATDPEQTVRFALASRRLPETVTRILLQDPDIDVRSVAAAGLVSQREAATSDVTL